ncbi:hypothetical protein DPEC_G00112290 [Dallia pectoralis]|uniref:Uncharacterized protein n=1 Tax=Dallia pectoralis TaxID=75939 RepID=A0ACC2GTM0_DALPE|nr:hypothetical protein DPEC_G00112290 [Dallia pectoralis]
MLPALPAPADICRTAPRRTAARASEREERKCSGRNKQAANHAASHSSSARSPKVTETGNQDAGPKRRGDTSPVRLAANVGSKECDNITQNAARVSVALQQCRRPKGNICMLGPTTSRIGSP